MRDVCVPIVWPNVKDHAASIAYSFISAFSNSVSRFKSSKSQMISIRAFIFFRPGIGAGAPSDRCKAFASLFLAHRRAEFDGVAFDRGFNSSGFSRMTMFVIKAKVIDMNSSLTPELEKFVGTKVESGRRNSASEVVREALRLPEEHDQARAGQLAEFNRELGRRLDSLDRGQRIDPADARARLQRKSEARRKSGG